MKSIVFVVFVQPHDTKYQDETNFLVSFSFLLMEGCPDGFFAINIQMSLRPIINL